MKFILMCYVGLSLVVLSSVKLRFYLYSLLNQKTMKKFIAHLKSSSPYSQSKYHKTVKLPGELSGAYEERTWRERLHYDSENNVYIPGTQFANAVRSAAKYLNIQIPGKGKSTFTKNFDSGIMVTDNIYIGVKKDDVEREYTCVTANGLKKDNVVGEWVYVPSDGRVGGTTRVEKCFGKIAEWEGTLEFHILDPIITEDVFLKVLEAAGSLIGVGRFRPRNRGWYGRFEVVDYEWIDE